MWFRGGLLVCLLVTPAYAQDVRTTSIFAGSVVDSVTRQPIAKASIRLTGEVTYGGSTNLEGAFRFEAVKPGEYQFDISHRGYTDSHAVALKPGQTNGTVILKPGEDFTGVMAGLAPEAVVSGHVVDANDEPPAGASVRLLTEKWQHGVRAYEIAASAEVDDRGNYRASVPAGVYYAAAHPYSRLPTRIAAEPGGEEKHLATVFYPNALTIESSTPVELQAGRQLAGIDFKVPYTAIYHVRGSVVGESGAYMLTLARREERVLRQINGALVEKDGKFDVSGVEPGNYWLEIEPVRSSLTGRVAVDVSDRDVNGVKLNAVHLSVDGIARFEGEHGDPLSALTLQLEMLDQLYFGSGRQFSIGGAFELKNLMCDRYALTLVPSRDAYIKSVLVGGREAPSGLLDFSNCAAAKLEVVVASGTGKVSGTVHWPEVLPGDPPLPGKPLSAALVATAGDTGNIGAFFVPVDAAGHFQFSFVPPGKYVAFATTRPGDGIWQNRDFVNAVSGSGTPVEVSKASEAHVEVPPLSEADIRRALQQAPR
jgi:hypothetical protein